MPVNHVDITVPVHGSTFHSVCILITKIICVQRGYKLKNPETFSRLTKNPGIPDVYVSYEYKGKDDYGHNRTFEQSVCIEIETDATNTSILKKTEQFSRPGMRETIIIDMNGLDEYKKKQIAKGLTRPNDISWIEAYIDSRLVI